MSSYFFAWIGPPISLIEFVLLFLSLNLSSYFFHWICPPISLIEFVLFLHWICPPFVLSLIGYFASYRRTFCCWVILFPSFFHCWAEVQQFFFHNGDSTLVFYIFHFNKNENSVLTYKTPNSQHKIWKKIVQLDIDPYLVQHNSFAVTHWQLPQILTTVVSGVARKISRGGKTFQRGWQKFRNLRFCDQKSFFMNSMKLVIQLH